MKKRIIACALTVVMVLTMAFSLSACAKDMTVTITDSTAVYTVIGKDNMNVQQFIDMAQIKLNPRDVVTPSLETVFKENEDHAITIQRMVRVKVTDGTSPKDVDVALGGTVADATGHGLTATPMGAYATSSARYTGNDAPIGHARQTGGNASTKGYLSIPNYDSRNVGDTFTMSGWVRATGLANYPRLFSRKESHTAANGWEIEMSNSFTSFKARGASNNPVATGNFSDDGFKNKWMHVAIVYNGKSLKVYQNGGEVVGNGTVTEATDNQLPLSIGCNSNGNNGHIQGAFDECRLLDAVASEDWIAAEYATVASAAFVTAGEVKTVGGRSGVVVLVR